jgi:preprotein translocase subunit SecE
MAMNREQKRLMQRQGQIGPDGEPVAKKRQRAAPQPKTKEQRTRPLQFLREVRGELRKVAWPTRSEVRNYSIIVLVTVVLLTTLIALLDVFFSKFVLNLLNV